MLQAVGYVKRSAARSRFALGAALLALGLYWALPRAPAPAEPNALNVAPIVSRRAPPDPRAAATPPTASAPSLKLEGPGRVTPPPLNAAHAVATHGATAAHANEPAAGAEEHPHPITPQHRRIFEENNRIGALNGALDQGDFVALRRMNAQYRKDYPEDDHDLQEGYELIASCLEQRTPRVQAEARRFWQTHRASMLRRQVRRHCLEQSVASAAVVCAPE